MLRIYREGGGRGGLGLEVERWEGIVREVGCDPIGLKEMSETEKKVKILHTASVGNINLVWYADLCGTAQFRNPSSSIHRCAIPSCNVFTWGTA